MTTMETVPGAASPWGLARLLVFVLAAAFAGLLADIRVEHVDVVRETWKAWIPIYYSGTMAAVCVLAGIFWNRAARIVMLILFLLAFVVGGLGFYFHNHGNFGNVFNAEVSAWTDPNMKHLRGPPQMAPLAFAGLGLLGVLATMRRFN